MRFLFEGGGRSGIRSAEDLGHALETYLDNNRHLGGMLVDFSETYDQPGELFRYKHDLLHDMSIAIGKCRENKASILHGPDLAAMWQHLGGRYWAEGESIALDRATGAGKTKPPRTTI